jgi:hypothetical protein
LKTKQAVRRRQHRFSAGLPAAVQFEIGEMDCTAHDLSRTGVLLHGDIPPPGRSVVMVKLRTSAGDLRVSLPGRAIRCERDEEARETLLAVEFLSIQEPDRHTFEAILARVIEGAAPAAIASLPPKATPAEVRAALDSVPLPHRITLAARGTPREREILFQDSHLQVIDALARNPNLLLHELLHILRMPNALPHTLESISRDQRWRGHAQVSVLLASHRNTPLAVAEKIIGQLPQATRQKILQAPDLHPALRAKLLAHLPRR